MVSNLNLIRIRGNALYSVQDTQQQRSVNQPDSNALSAMHDTDNQHTEKQLVQNSSDDSHIERPAKSSLVPEEVMKIYFETKNAYVEETGADFSSTSSPLAITTVFLFGHIELAGSGLNTPGRDTPIHTGKFEDIPGRPVPKPKKTSIIDHLYNVLDDISHRDEAWVRRQTHPSYAETPMGKAYIERTVVGYRHMTELIKRFIDALQRATDPNATQTPLPIQLLDVMV